MTSIFVDSGQGTPVVPDMSLWIMAEEWDGNPATARQFRIVTEDDEETVIIE